MGLQKIAIKDIKPNSIADEMGIEKGDKLISINGKHIEDILEYKFLTCDEVLIIEVEKADGEIWELDIEKDYDEDLGFIFDGIIDKQKTCCNKCIFCFIDQLPKGMRNTLYFKDDDTRLSFLQGNFVTLTNLKDEDINKIIRYRISPINISIHTTDMELRKKMLNNKNAVNVMKYLDKLKIGGIEMKGQIVLCPGINDGLQLSRTVDDLYKYYPQLSCLAAVPVGLTKYREGLYPLISYDRVKSLKIISQIETIQKKCYSSIGTQFIFISDEFYVLASKELPSYDSYEGFPQLENGVGLIRLFQNEVKKSLEMQLSDNANCKKAAIITGEYAKPYLREAADAIMNRFRNTEIETYSISNDFFGDSVKVAGLIVGKDIITQLKNINTCKNVLIPDNMLKRDEKVFLDDLTVKDIEEALGIKITICKQDGSDLVKNILEKC